MQTLLAYSGCLHKRSCQNQPLKQNLCLFMLELGLHHDRPRKERAPVYLLPSRSPLGEERIRLGRQTGRRTQPKDLKEHGFSISRLHLGTCCHACPHAMYYFLSCMQFRRNIALLASPSKDTAKSNVTKLASETSASPPNPVLHYDILPTQARRWKGIRV